MRRRICSAVVAMELTTASGGARPRRRARGGSPGQRVASGAPVPLGAERGTAPGAPTRWSGEPSAGTATPAALELRPEAYRAVAHGQPGARARAGPRPRAPRARGARRPSDAARRRAQAATNASPRRASRTASDRPLRRDASARRARRSAPQRRDARPASAPVACASARAVATPMRSPVNVPGPTPTPMRVDVAEVERRRRASAARASGSSCSAWRGRSPGAGVVAELDDRASGAAGRPDDGRRASRCRRRGRASAVVTSAPRAVAARRARGARDARPRPSRELGDRASGHSTNTIGVRPSSSSSSAGSSSSSPAGRAGSRSRCEIGDAAAVVAAADRERRARHAARRRPSARSAPRTNVVLPAPSSPATQDDVAGRSSRPARAPTRLGLRGAVGRRRLGR